MMLGPNITGTLRNDATYSVFVSKGAYDGVFYFKNLQAHDYQGSGGGNGGSIVFDASKSNPLFKNSTTVQPSSLTSLILIKS